MIKEKVMVNQKRTDDFKHHATAKGQEKAFYYQKQMKCYLLCRQTQKQLQSILDITFQWAGLKSFKRLILYNNVHSLWQAALVRLKIGFISPSEKNLSLDFTHASGYYNFISLLPFTVKLFESCFILLISNSFSPILF